MVRDVVPGYVCGGRRVRQVLLPAHRWRLECGRMELLGSLVMLLLAIVIFVLLLHYLPGGKSGDRR
jgi:hypothetical protein